MHDTGGNGEWIARQQAYCTIFQIYVQLAFQDEESLITIVMLMPMIFPVNDSRSSSSCPIGSAAGRRAAFTLKQAEKEYILKLPFPFPSLADDTLLMEAGMFDQSLGCNVIGVDLDLQPIQLQTVKANVQQSVQGSSWEMGFSETDWRDICSSLSQYFWPAHQNVRIAGKVYNNRWPDHPVQFR